MLGMQLLVTFKFSWMSKPVPKQTINLSEFNFLQTSGFKFEVYAKLRHGWRALIYTREIYGYVNKLNKREHLLGVFYSRLFINHRPSYSLAEIRWTFIEFWLNRLNVQMFQLLIVICRRGNFVYHLRGCTSICGPLSYPFRSLIKLLIQFCLRKNKVIKVS